MSGSRHIQYLTRQQIDKEKWDDCIRHAPNGLIYAYSYYLDHMAENWDALVMADYETVMPLTWNKKYGIAYLYQPFLTAQLGVFGKNIDAERVKTFLNAIPGKFRYIDIYLNHQNYFAVAGFDLYQRRNYVLNLSKSYEDLVSDYSENIRRNARKAIQAGCSLQKEFTVEDVIELALLQMKKTGNQTIKSVERFRKLYGFLHQKQMATTYGIIDQKNELLASCVFFFSHNRAYYILVGNHPNGKIIGSSHLLIDAFIKDHSGKNMFLDFEGSDIRSLALFYSSFGASEEKFAGLKVNKLPFYLKWLKG